MQRAKQVPCILSTAKDDDNNGTVIMQEEGPNDWTDYA